MRTHELKFFAAIHIYMPYMLMGTKSVEDAPVDLWQAERRPEVDF